MLAFGGGWLVLGLLKGCLVFFPALFRGTKQIPATLYLADLGHPPQILYPLRF